MAFLLGAGQAHADVHVDKPIWSPPPIDATLTEALNAACGSLPARTCDVAAVLRNDHAYVYPAATPAQTPLWDAACLRAPYLDRGVARGVPAQYQAKLRAVPSDVLATWVAAEGPLRRLDINTITFCGFRLDDVFGLDWSATEARVRFDLVEFTKAARPPLGTVASRGIFSGGLTIDRSTIDTDLRLEDSRFAAFVEIERSRFHGTLRAENTQIGGSLRLRDNAFEGAVRMQALVIGGDTIISGNTFPSIVDDQPREPDGTSFSVVRLRELRLGGVLEFVDNAFDIVPGGRPARSLYVQKSTIRDNDVTIHRNAFAGRVYLIELEGKKFTVSQNAFAEFFELSSSNVYSFRSFDNHYLGPYSITSNRVESSLVIDGDIFDKTATRLLDVRNNQVGHELRFAPKSWPAESYTVDFGFNDVVGPLSFYWPLMNAGGRGVVSCIDWRDPEAGRVPRWLGEINFVGTRVQTSLHVVEGCSYAPSERIVPFPDHGPAIAETKAQLPGPHTIRSAKTIIDFTLVETGVLRLDLPASGAYAWRGKGLDFEFFGASNQGQVAVVNGDAQAGLTERSANDQLVAWLDRLERPDPEVYFSVADYLRGRGEIDRSREWLARGRAVDFGPTNCAGLTDCSRGWVTKAILFPSDFGTRPELVAVWLVALWVAMTAVYWLHHRGLLALFHGSAHTSPLPVVATGRGPGVEEEKAPWGPPPTNQRGSGAVPATDGRPQDYPTQIAGFVAHKPEHANRRFSLWVYSLDVTLPVISLDHFRVFTPTSTTVRGLSILHHVAGWWLVTLFFGASFF